MQRGARLLCVVGLLAICTSWVAHAQYDGYDYDYGYDSEYTDEEYEYLDEYGYYENDDEAYYDYYGYYADDFDDADDYDDYYYDYYEDEDYSSGVGGLEGDLESTGAAAAKKSGGGVGGAKAACRVEEGKPLLANGTVPCDLKIAGVDKVADLLTGGADGVYKLTGCFNGKPLYTREKSPAGEERVLYFSSSFGDWDISKGTTPNEAEILVYGGEVEYASSPVFVEAWNLGADLHTGSQMEEDDYMPISMSVKCADGKVYEEEKYNPQAVKVGPVLTGDEMEAKYQQIYDTYGRRPEPNPAVNFTFVVMLVMVGLTVVLVIPYFLLHRRAGKAPPPQGTFAHMIQQSKKKSSGHIN